MRLLLDAQLSPTRIGRVLREHGHDVRAVAGEPGVEELDDESLLELAMREERVLVTRNSRDFAPICRAWAEAGREHTGVILIWTHSNSEHAAIVRDVERWLDELPAASDWRGLVVAV